MKMNYKHLGMYVLVGIASAWATLLAMSGMSRSGSSENLVAYIVLTAIWLPIFILVVGDSVSDMRCRSDWFSPLAFITLCCIGWWAAFFYGAINYSINFDNKCTWFCNLEMVVSGGIGGISVGVGLALAWKVRRIGIVIVSTTLAGLLGGLILSQIYSEDNFFIVWQPIVLLGIGIAVQIDSAKSSAEQ